MVLCGVNICPLFPGAAFCRCSVETRYSIDGIERPHKNRWILVAYMHSVPLSIMIRSLRAPMSSVVIQKIFRQSS